MLTVDNILSSSGKYPERAKSPELTTELRANAEDLCKRINNLLNLIYKAEVKVSSGFRPSSVNSKIPNAAKKSLHMQCKACDLEDKDGKLKEILINHLDEKCNTSDDGLTLFGLWLEDPSKTPGWIHLDTGKRSPRKRKVFLP